MHTQSYIWIIVAAAYSHETNARMYAFPFVLAVVWCCPSNDSNTGTVELDSPRGV